MVTVASEATSAEYFWMARAMMLRAFLSASSLTSISIFLTRFTMSSENSFSALTRSSSRASSFFSLLTRSSSLVTLPSCSDSFFSRSVSFSSWVRAWSRRVSASSFFFEISSLRWSSFSWIFSILERWSLSSFWASFLRRLASSWISTAFFLASSSSSVWRLRPFSMMRRASVWASCLAWRIFWRCAKYPPAPPAARAMSATRRVVESIFGRG